MRRIHYAWLIAAAGFVLMFCNIGLSSNLFTIYLPFIEEKGISGAQGSSIATVKCIVTFACTFGASYFYRRVSLRSGMAFATAMSAVGCVIMAFGGANIWIYYMGAAAYGISYALGAVFPNALMIERWFRKSRGLALGIASTGTGLASMAFAPVITKLIIAYGLRFTYLFHACIAMLCAVIIFAIVRNSPEELGLEPYGQSLQPETVTVVSDSDKNSEGVRISKDTWVLMLLMMLIVGGAGTAVPAHMSIASRSAGYTAEQAALSITVNGAFIIIGKLLYGRVADRIGALKATIGFVSVFAAGCLSTLLLLTGVPAAPFIFAVLEGIGCPFFNIGVPLWARDLSCAEDYERTLKIYQIAYHAGGIVFSFLPGMIADRTGEYISSYVAIAVGMLVCMVLLGGFYRARARKYVR